MQLGPRNLESQKNDKVRTQRTEKSSDSGINTTKVNKFAKTKPSQQRRSFRDEQQLVNPTQWAINQAPDARSKTHQMICFAVPRAKMKSELGTARYPRRSHLTGQAASPYFSTSKHEKLAQRPPEIQSEKTYKLPLRRPSRENNTESYNPNPNPKQQTSYNPQPTQQTKHV